MATQTKPPLERPLAPTSLPGAVGTAAIALAALCAALLLSWGIQVLQASFGQQNERAVMMTAVLFAVILMAAPGVYLLREGTQSKPETAGLVFLSACTVVLMAVYFYCVASYVFFPADFLVWSEGDFVNDVLKFSTGYPLYTPAVNMDSTHYVPGPQLLTYFLSWIAGQGVSIPVFRMIQLGYTAAAAFLATLCCWKILRLARPQFRLANALVWTVFAYATLFLMATNSITNRFAHNLHGDSLAQLATIASYYVLLSYIESRSRVALAGMILLVPVDFLIKQNLLIWGVFYVAYLALADRRVKRALAVACGIGVLFGAIVALFYAAWGQPFVFWIFEELSRHAVSPLRSFQHMLDSWPYFAAGLLGGAAILRDRKPDGLFGAWIVWLVLILGEAYTSGIEWMLNHIGPGCLMAGIWFLAGLASLSSPAGELRKAARIDAWIRVGALTAVLALMFNGFGLVRIPLKPISADAYRYVRDIEKQFEGTAPKNILLDVGTWVYAKDRVVMGDRAPAAGMLAMAKTDEFAGIRSRIAAKRYSKILVRNLHEPDFWYENAIWPKPSGLRSLLLANYRETGTIRAAEGPKDVKNWAEDPYLFGAISILEPKTATAK